MKKNRIHVVSFQVPYPANYGGAIDVYYKLRALHDEGFEVVLHTYAYDGRGPQAELEKWCSEVYYYPRETGWKRQISLLPYIVASRRSPELLQRLTRDSAPILFEGIHTCYFLAHPLLSERKKIVRMHNVEHDYYRQLARQAGWSWRSIYYYIESLRLRWFERKLNHAQLICAITKADEEVFRHLVCVPQLALLPVFFDTAPLDQPLQPLPPSSLAYVLYQGNMAVEENRRVANFIADEIAPRCPGVLFVIAGRQARLQNVPRNIKLVDTPTDKELDELIRGARIHLMLTFQPTGIKLKLLNALTKGRGIVIANHDMLYGHGLGRFCERADDPADIAALINELIYTSLDEEAITKRVLYLQKMKKAGISRLSLFK